MAEAVVAQIRIAAIARLADAVPKRSTFDEIPRLKLRGCPWPETGASCYLLSALRGPGYTDPAAQNARRTNTLAPLPRPLAIRDILVEVSVHYLLGVKTNDD